MLLSPFLVLVAGIVLAGCTAESPSATQPPAPATSQAPATQAAKTPIKIGLIGPFTGPAKENGQMMLNNMKFAVKQTNDAGGILGGRKVEYIICDDQADPVQASTVTQKAITMDKVAAMVGTWETGAAKACRDVCREYDIPLVLSDSDGIDTYVEGYYGLFHMGASPSAEIAPVVSYMETNKLKSLAVVYDDLQWSRFISRLLHDRWDKPGASVKIVSEVFHALGKTEIKAEYTQATSSNPDLIALCEWTGNSAKASIQATSELSYKGARFSFSGTANSRMLRGLGPAADGVMLAANFLPDPNVPENAAYVKAYTSQVDDQITNEGAMAYDAVNVLLKAMDKAGTDTDARKITDAIFNSDYTLLAGKCPAKFDKYGHIQRPGQYIGSVRDGKMVDVSYFTYPNDIEKEDLALYGKELPPAIYVP